jgi:hypothetical protein
MLVVHACYPIYTLKKGGGAGGTAKV